MTTQTMILVVEDQPNEREALARMLRMAQYEVIATSSPDEAMSHLDKPVELVISDLRLGDADGIDLLRRWKERRSETPFILVTAYGDVPTAVEAMKLGAADYMTKPVNPESLLQLIQKWLEKARTNGHGDQESIGIPPGTSLEELERAAVERALEEHHGNRTHAAKTLGISVRTLQRKLKAWRMPMFAVAHPSSQQHPGVYAQRH
jgi:DNA-binding NtrC family response regulator